MSQQALVTGAATDRRELTLNNQILQQNLQRQEQKMILDALGKQQDAGRQYGVDQYLADQAALDAFGAAQDRPALNLNQTIATQMGLGPRTDGGGPGLDIGGLLGGGGALLGAASTAGLFT